MPTSNSKPQQSPATDSPLGSPAGNEPYKTIRARNWADRDGSDNKPAGNEPHATQTMGNVAMPPDDPIVPQAKPAQEG